jgi:hypothetical protein
MKNIIRIAVIQLSLLSLVGCKDHAYRNASNWTVTDDVFMQQYLQFYTSSITMIYNKYDFEYTQEVAIEEDNRFSITYQNDCEVIKFIFLNDRGGFGHYRSNYYYFNDDLEGIFFYEHHNAILAFVSEINSIVSFDYQGDVDTYYDLYVNHLTHQQNTYFYHFDSVVGYIGYGVTWNNHFSDAESRWYISFGYTSLLKPIGS